MNSGLVGYNSVTGRVFHEPQPLRLQGVKVRWETHHTISSLTLLLGLLDSFEQWTDRFSQNVTD